MCLYYNKEASEKLAAEIAAGRTTFYKVYELAWDNKSLIAPCQQTEVEPDANGFVRSDRESVGLTPGEADLGNVYKGIHVHTTYELADRSVNQQEIVVPVTVAAEDFVGCDVDAQEAVFLKVRIDLATLPQRISDEVERLTPVWEDLADDLDGEDDWDDWDDLDDWDDDDDDEDDDWDDDE